MQKNTKLIYIVRHGETESNSKGLVQGQSDPNLIEKGRKQIQEVSNKLSKINFDHFYTSPLKRAIESAQIMGEILNIHAVPIDSLKEQTFGILEGKSKEELMQYFQVNKWNQMSFTQKRNFKIDNSAESDQEALNRLLEFLKKILNDESAKHILIIMHGTIMRHLLIDLGEATYERQAKIHNGGMIKIEAGETLKLIDYFKVDFYK